MSKPTLVLGNLNYSSWSARAWLALRAAGVEFEERRVGLFVDEGWREKLRGLSPTGKVPVLIDGDLVIHEALAICEYVAECHPDARLWPANACDRATARALSAEMASGFANIRSKLGTHVRGRVHDFEPDDETRAELDRVVEIWDHARPGAYLLGDFCIADIMYAPVVSRFVTWGIGVEGAAEVYQQRVLAHPLVLEWFERARAESSIPMYDALLAT